MRKSIGLSVVVAALFVAQAARSQTASNALLQNATLGSNLVDYVMNTPLDNAAGNTNPLFNLAVGQKLLFGVGATGTFPDYLTATFAGDFFTLADPNVNGTVVYPISTQGGNSYRELLTFTRAGSYQGTIGLNLLVANPDYSYNGGSARREAPVFTFRVNVVDATVPEPATWSMMVAGFGLSGAALRRRRERPVRII